MKSIIQKNLLKYRPILVDSEFRVIDGQHRLEAAKRLDLPIFYEMQESLKVEDMRLLNQAMRIWKRADYLKHFVAEKYPEYIKLQKFLDKTGLSIENALVSLGINTHLREKKRSDNPFQEGKFVFPSMEVEVEALHIIKRTEDIKSFLEPKLVGSRLYLRGPLFRRAIFIFLSAKCVEFDVFMRKLEYKLDLMRPCARLEQYLQIFQDIYNWKTINKISVTDMV